MNVILKNIVWLWLLLFIIIGSSQTGQAQRTAYLVQHDNIDVCGDENDKKFTVSLNIGEVKRSDSLFGYNFRINFNQEKVKFEIGSFQSTLGQNLQEKRVTIINDSGQIAGFAVNLNFNLPPAAGDKPLAAFRGKYLGDCPDTTTIVIESLGFTEEFQLNITEFENLDLAAEMEDKESRKIEPESNKDTVEFADEDKGLFITKFKYEEDAARLNTLSFKLELDEINKFTISDVTSINENFNIIEKEPYEKGLIVKAEVMDNINDMNVMQVELEEMIDEDLVSNLYIKDLEVNDCSCITNFYDKEICLKSVKDTSDTTSVDYVETAKDNKILGSYDLSSDHFVFQSESCVIRNVQLYNVQGIKVDNKRSSDCNRFFRIEAGNRIPGIYFAIITDILGQQHKIVLIKN